MTPDLDLFGIVESVLSQPPSPEAPTAAEDTAINKSLSTHILDPITGELLDPADIDSLIDAYERIDARDKQHYAAKLAIRQALASRTEGDAKTRRVQGHRRKAIVEMPSDSWDQAKLKQIWELYPDLREQCLKIDSIGVKLREYKKLVNTSGTPEFQAFRDNVTAANKGQTGTPTVKIEG